MLQGETCPVTITATLIDDKDKEQDTAARKVNGILLFVLMLQQQAQVFAP